MKDKEVEITNFKGDFYIGQSVRVIGKTSQGFKALFFGYILPLMVLLIVLILSLSFTNEEGLSGVLALAALIPYYVILFLLRNKFKRNFEFDIKPL